MKPKKCGWSIAELERALQINNQKLMELHKTQKEIKQKIFRILAEMRKVKVCIA